MKIKFNLGEISLNISEVDVEFDISGDEIKTVATSEIGQDLIRRVNSETASKIADKFFGKKCCGHVKKEDSDTVRVQDLLHSHGEQSSTSQSDDQPFEKSLTYNEKVGLLEKRIADLTHDITVSLEGNINMGFMTNMLTRLVGMKKQLAEINDEAAANGDIYM